MLMFGRGVCGADLGDGLDNLVVGYITWFVLLSPINHSHNPRQLNRTLEQLYMAP